MTGSSPTIQPKYPTQPIPYKSGWIGYRSYHELGWVEISQPMEFNVPSHLSLTQSLNLGLSAMYKNMR